MGAVSPIVRCLADPNRCKWAIQHERGRIAEAAWRQHYMERHYLHADAAAPDSVPPTTDNDDCRESR